MGNDFQENLADTPAPDLSERHLDLLRQKGGVFVDAVRLTRMPMIVTDATLPGNPIVFANAAFTQLSGFSEDELLGQEPHFMNGEDTGPAAITDMRQRSGTAGTRRSKFFNTARTARRFAPCCSRARSVMARVA